LAGAALPGASLPAVFFIIKGDPFPTHSEPNLGPEPV
jgi:hypothetical protein